MPNTSILTKIACSLLCLTAASNLQAQTLTDPGISQHNYKMPDKAVKAKIQERGQHFVISMSSISESQLTRLPKYAIGVSSIAIALNDKKQPMSINPLSSVSNYKTRPIPKMQSAQEEYSASLN